MPGSTASCWQRNYIPRLVADGVLVADTDGWLGRWAEIEAALLKRSPTSDVAAFKDAPNLDRILAWLRVLAASATYPTAATALATGTVSLAFNLVIAIPLLVVGAGLLAGRVAKALEPDRGR